VAVFQAALDGLGLPPARVVPYRDVIAGRTAMAEVIRPGSILRIESPGRDFDVERTLVAAGADIDDPEEDGDGSPPAPNRIGRAEALRHPFDRGLIFHPRQWYLGFREVLRRVDRQLRGCPPHAVMTAPAAIEILFDKPRCHRVLNGQGIPCPRALGPVRSYDELRSRMREAGLARVFVKLANGSSASGVVALATAPGRQRADTTVEMDRSAGGLRLYNSRRIQRYEDPREIAELIDALCRERVHVEQWIPKAGLDGMAFDLRVVVVAGRPGHIVPRLSPTPLTNLHLKNRRGDVEALRSRTEPAAWDAAMETCRRAALAFPGCHYAGVDLLIAPGYRRHAVLEVNAFGDLLPGITCRGRDTYTAEVAAWLRCDGEGSP
jgi:glutathione synthase/RimK-type ligase-like ATP-grasp enzyme